MKQDASDPHIDRIAIQYRGKIPIERIIRRSGCDRHLIHFARKPLWVAYLNQGTNFIKHPQGNSHGLLALKLYISHSQGVKRLLASIKKMLEPGGSAG